MADTQTLEGNVAARERVDAAPGRGLWRRLEPVAYGTSSIVLLLLVWQFVPYFVPLKAGTKLFFTVPSQVIGTLWTMIVTGSLWGKPMWGTYWVWDARLTSVLVLFIVYLGLVALWRSIEDPGRAARAAARKLRRLRITRCSPLRRKLRRGFTRLDPSSVVGAAGRGWRRRRLAGFHGWAMRPFEVADRSGAKSPW